MGPVIRPGKKPETSKTQHTTRNEKADRPTAVPTNARRCACHRALPGSRPSFVAEKCPDRADLRQLRAGGRCRRRARGPAACEGHCCAGANAAQAPPLHAAADPNVVPHPRVGEWAVACVRGKRPAVRIARGLSMAGHMMPTCKLTPPLRQAFRPTVERAQSPAGEHSCWPVCDPPLPVALVAAGLTWLSAGSSLRRLVSAPTSPQRLHPQGWAGAPEPNERCVTFTAVTFVFRLC